MRVTSSSPMIEEGTTAPEFTLPDQEGEDVSLADFRGQPVVLYFYPKADTPGCTTQACGIRDHRADYEAAGAVVLGVSPDPVKAVTKFAGKQSLDFRLLADEDHAVCELYGVWAEKSMYGRTYWAAKPASRRRASTSPGACSRSRCSSSVRRKRPSPRSRKLTMRRVSSSPASVASTSTAQPSPSLQPRRPPGRSRPGPARSNSSRPRGRSAACTRGRTASSDAAASRR